MKLRYSFNGHVLLVIVSQLSLGTLTDPVQKIVCGQCGRCLDKMRRRVELDIESSFDTTFCYLETIVEIRLPYRIKFPLNIIGDAADPTRLASVLIDAIHPRNFPVCPHRNLEDPILTQRMIQLMAKSRSHLSSSSSEYFDELECDSECFSTRPGFEMEEICGSCPTTFNISIPTLFGRVSFIRIQAIRKLGSLADAVGSHWLRQIIMSFDHNQNLGQRWKKRPGSAT